MKVWWIRLESSMYQ